MCWTAHVQYQDPGNPNWEFQRKIMEFKISLDVDPLLGDEPVSLRTVSPSPLNHWLVKCNNEVIFFHLLAGDSF